MQVQYNSFRILQALRVVLKVRVLGTRKLGNLVCIFLVRATHTKSEPANAKRRGRISKRSDGERRPETRQRAFAGYPEELPRAWSGGERAGIRF